jgi:hypothetical protein
MAQLIHVRAQADLNALKALPFVEKLILQIKP